MSTFEETGVQSGEESIGGDQSQKLDGSSRKVTGKAKELLRA